MDKNNNFTRHLMGVVGGELKWSGDYRYDYDSGNITLVHRYSDKDYNIVERKITFKLEVLSDTESLVPEDKLEKSVIGSGYND